MWVIHIKRKMYIHEARLSYHVAKEHLLSLKAQMSSLKCHHLVFITQSSMNGQMWTYGGTPHKSCMCKYRFPVLSLNTHTIQIQFDFVWIGAAQPYRTYFCVIDMTVWRGIISNAAIPNELSVYRICLWTPIFSGSRQVHYIWCKAIRDMKTCLKYFDISDTS